MPAPINASAQAVWRRVLARMQPRVQTAAFEAWLAPCEARQCAPDALVLAVPDDTYVYWLAKNFTSLICQAFAQEFGQPPARLSFEVLDDANGG